MVLTSEEIKSKDFELLKLYQNQVNELLLKDKYISKKEYLKIYKQLTPIIHKLKIMEKESMLELWCQKNKVDYYEIKSLINFYTNTNKIIDDKNTLYINKHLEEDKEYLDTILVNEDPNIKLDKEQRKVILSDEDYTLVVAGAGSGKTTTIEAKVKYLIEKQHIDPNRILIISFTRKATNELQTRCKKLGLPVKISTFHSLANQVIGSSEESHHQITTGDLMFKTIKEYLINNENDEEFVKKILLFFASYLNVPFGEKNISLLFTELAKNDCTTLKSDITTSLDEFNKKQISQKYTLKNEKVKSVEECRIANFLYINGIDYEYEPVYKYCFNNTIKPYCPDFIIRQYGKEIYLEHFGISESGENPRYSKEELEQYKKHVNDKIMFHRKHGTKLIYTFSKYNDNKDTITHLKEELIKSGISFEPKNQKAIYKAILSNLEDKYFNKLVQLICVFISRFKTNNFSPTKFDEWKITLSDERTKLFVNICYECYLAYSSVLKNTGSIDFEDMINNASNVLDKLIENHQKLPYDYIFVDEYQDISIQRFNLCEKLSKCSNAKIVAVGDDWQSIFKFSGAQIDLFTKFEQIMGYANIQKITNTYRNSQELIDIAGNFVMSNKYQITKKLKSNKSIKNPVILMTYNDKKDFISYKLGDTVTNRLGSAIEHALDNIVKENGINQKVLFIGRYGFEQFILSNYKEGFTYKRNKLYSNKYPKLNITFLTAHSSKGLTYDNVIIINGKDAILGFPSRIVDDPVMKLVIKDEENFEYAEERRLFYVALTRTKNKVYILTPKYRPSKFILELNSNYKNVLVVGEKIEPEVNFDNLLKCPLCSYPLQRRSNNNFKIPGEIWICSNDPEICGYVTNNPRGGKMSISKCPKCSDGYLIVKKVPDPSKEKYILGCTNYLKDGTGCNAYLVDNKYTQDLELVNLEFFDKNTDIKKITYCNKNFIELVNTIIYIVKYYENYKFKISPRTILEILVGASNKQIKVFKLYKNKYYGYLTVDDRQKYWALFKALTKEEILNVDESNYNNVTVIKDHLTLDDYKIIYASIKIK